MLWKLNCGYLSQMGEASMHRAANGAQVRSTIDADEYGKGENAMRTVSRALVVIGLLIGSGICAMAGGRVPVPVPEPPALLVLGSSLGILGFMLRRKKG